METIPLLAASIKREVQRSWEMVSVSALTDCLDLPEVRVTHFEKDGAQEKDVHRLAEGSPSRPATGQSDGSTDMWEPYRQAIHEALPWAQHVADRFHVMKQLNERLSLARRAIQKRADKATSKALKGSRWILVRARDELNAKEEAKLQAVDETSFVGCFS